MWLKLDNKKRGGVLVNMAHVIRVTPASGGASLLFDDTIRRTDNKPGPATLAVRDTVEEIGAMLRLTAAVPKKRWG